jgi:beta-galactosidase
MCPCCLIHREYRYSNCPTIQLELNGKVVGVQNIPFFGMATFTVPFVEGTLTAHGLDGGGKPVAQYSIGTVGVAAAILLTIDAPSVITGTGSELVADGEDTAMLRATIVDAKGVEVPFASQNVTFKVLSGPGVVWATHNGDPANDSPSGAPWTPAYGPC